MREGSSRTLGPFPLLSAIPVFLVAPEAIAAISEHTVNLISETVSHSFYVFARRHLSHLVGNTHPLL